MLDRYSPAELIGFAGRFDSGLTTQDFGDAGIQLDHIADEEFFRYGLGARRCRSRGIGLNLRLGCL
jgi:hypothetical protein